MTTTNDSTAERETLITEIAGIFTAMNQPAPEEWSQEWSDRQGELDKRLMAICLAHPGEYVALTDEAAARIGMPSMAETTGEWMRG